MRQVASFEHCLTKLADAKKACKGGKNAKIRITLAFFVNAAGVKEVPIVIGKSALPQSFKGIEDKKKASWCSILC